MIELGMHYDAALDNVRIFFARMTDQLPELSEGPGMDVGQDREHSLATKIWTKIEVAVVGCINLHRLINLSHAAARCESAQLAVRASYSFGEVSALATSSWKRQTNSNCWPERLTVSFIQRTFVLNKLRW